MFGRRAAAGGSNASNGSAPPPAVASIDPLAAFLDDDDLMARKREGKETHAPIGSPSAVPKTSVPAATATSKKVPSAMSWLEDEAESTNSQQETTASAMSAPNFAVLQPSASATGTRPVGVASTFNNRTSAPIPPKDDNASWLDTPPKAALPFQPQVTPSAATAHTTAFTEHPPPQRAISPPSVKSAVVSTISGPSGSTIVSSTGRSLSPVKALSPDRPQLDSTTKSTGAHSTNVPLGLSGTPSPAAVPNTRIAYSLTSPNTTAVASSALVEEAAALEATLADLNTSIAQKQGMVSVMQRSMALVGQPLLSDESRDTDATRLYEALSVAAAASDVTNGGTHAAAESAAYERRRRVEEAKVLQAQSHRERMRAIYQRTQDAISDYRRNAVANAEGESRRQLQLLTKAIAEEKEAISTLTQEQAASLTESAEAAVEAVLNGRKADSRSDKFDPSTSAITALNGHLQAIITRMRKDFQDTASFTLESQLRSSVESLRDERLKSFTEEKSKRVTLFKLHTEARGRALESFTDQRKKVRQRAVDETMGTIKLEWDKFVIDTKVRAATDASEADKRISADLAKTRNEGQHALERVVAKQKAFLDDFNRSAAHRESETRTKVAMEAAHQLKLFESEKQSVEQTYKYAQEAQERSMVAFGGATSFNKQVAAIEATALHAKRLADEVDVVTYSAATHRATEESRKQIKERESAIDGLSKHIDNQRETLMRDWVKIQQMLSTLTGDADHFGKSMAQGRSSLIAAQQYVDTTRSAWEKELFRTMGNCFAGGTEAIIHRSEDITGQILFDLNCKVRDLLMKAEALMAVRRDMEGQIQAQDLQVADCKEKEGATLRKLLSLYETISKTSEAVDQRQRSLQVEKKDLLDAIEATQSERGRITRRLEDLQRYSGQMIAGKFDSHVPATVTMTKSYPNGPLHPLSINKNDGHSHTQHQLPSSSITSVSIPSSAVVAPMVGTQRAYHTFLGAAVPNTLSAGNINYNRRSSSSASQTTSSLGNVDRFHHLYNDLAVDQTTRTAKDFISLVRLDPPQRNSSSSQADRSDMRFQGEGGRNTGGEKLTISQPIQDDSDHAYAATALSFVDADPQDQLRAFEQLHYLSSTSRSSGGVNNNSTALSQPRGGDAVNESARAWENMYQNTNMPSTSSTSKSGTVASSSGAAGATTLYANIGPSVSDRGNNSYTRLVVGDSGAPHEGAILGRTSVASLTTPSSIFTS